MIIRHGCILCSLVQSTGHDRPCELNWTNQLLAWRPAAGALTGVDHDDDVRHNLKRAALPTPKVWDMKHDPIDICVGIDHFEAAHDMGNYVAELGYRKPAFCGLSAGLDTLADKRVAGLGKAFKACGANSLERIVLAPENAFIMGRQGFDSRHRTNRADVIFFLNNYKAFGGMMAA